MYTVVPGSYWELAERIAARNGADLRAVREYSRCPHLKQLRRVIAQALQSAGASTAEAGLVLGRDPSSIRHRDRKRTRRQKP